MKCLDVCGGDYSQLRRDKSIVIGIKELSWREDVITNTRSCLYSKALVESLLLLELEALDKVIKAGIFRMLSQINGGYIVTQWS